LQAQGEFLCDLWKYADALETLKRAEKHFPLSDRSPDRALLEKWLGYATGKLGDRPAALAHFQKALQILHRPQFRAEAWLSIYRQMAELGLLDLPDLTRLLFYPGCPRQSDHSIYLGD